MKQLLPWDAAEEITFEAEPGTLTDHKLQAIRDMGSKAAAKSLMERAGVPLVPGYHGLDNSPALLEREALFFGVSNCLS